MIRTASFFKPEDHIGKLYSIADSKPPVYRVEAYGIPPREKGEPTPWSDSCGVIEWLWPGRQLTYALMTGRMDWLEYAANYRARLEEGRDYLESVFVGIDGDITLLCWEHSPDRCHRRLVAEYLRDEFDCDVEIR